MNRQFQQCKKQISEFKMKYGKNPWGYTEKCMNEFRILTKKRKNLSLRKEKLLMNISKKICRKYNFEILQDFNCIKIRNFALCNTVENLQKILPRLGNVFPKKKIPIFSYKIYDFATKLKNNNSAIEGGPCLIGVDEISLSLIFKGGKTRHFDIMTGFEEGLHNIYFPNRYDLAEIIVQNKNEIIDAEVKIKQCGPTIQNLIFLYRLMFISKNLELPLIIGLPDEAYRKFFTTVVNPLKNCEKIMKNFNFILDSIVNEFLDLIKNINSMLKLKQFDMFHSRNRKLLDIFYKNRVHVAYSLNNVTNHMIKKDAIIDYVCLPALPYFLWGANNILEINNLMEFESLKKTIITFPESNFAALSFPEIPDIVNESSMYYSKIENKIFLNNKNDLNHISNQILRKVGKEIKCQVLW